MIYLIFLAVKLFKHHEGCAMLQCNTVIPSRLASVQCRVLLRYRWQCITQQIIFDIRHLLHTNAVQHVTRIWAKVEFVDYCSVIWTYYSVICVKSIKHCTVIRSITLPCLSVGSYSHPSTCTSKSDNCDAVVSVSIRPPWCSVARHPHFSKTKIFISGYSWCRWT